LGVAFSPGDGDRLAVGYFDGTAVSRLDGHTLAALPAPDVAGIDNGDLFSVAWSVDGRTLFAAGRYQADGGGPVIAWAGSGAGARRVLPAGQSTVMSLVPLPGGDLLVASADPYLARLRPEEGARWQHGPPKADFRNQRDMLSVSADGARIDFGFAPFGKDPARFDLSTRRLTLDPTADGSTARPRQTGLPVEGWYNTFAPTLAGIPLALNPREMSRSLALSPAGDRFVLGTEWWLRAYDAAGTPLWRRPVPGAVWAVNVTGDGSLVVAACGDGTIRWHRMDNGAELLAFMPLADRANWVAWTPEGFYAASAGAQGVLRWHVNRGWDEAADSVPVENIPGSYRPELLPLVLQELETPRALGLAMLAEHRRLVMLRTNSRLPPGVELHLLAIGISVYNEEFARHLRLRFAHRDARDLASALLATQTSLYADIKPQVLLDKDATREGILRALKTLQDHLAGRENDLAVVHFSGHGALLDGKLYLLPHDVDARDSVGIKDKGLQAATLRDELQKLAERNRVLVLLDACHAGAATAAGTALPMDAAKLRLALAATNVTVLTSSAASEVSLESEAWQHGAFTRALLDALNDPDADLDRNGLISTNGLARFVNTRVHTLTEGAQTPAMEVRYQGTLFAVTR
jgi:hypothetical protein